MEQTQTIAASRQAAREAVLSKWYDAYGTDVLHLCCFYLGSRADAEDAVQETFIKAWRHLDRFRGPNSCSAKSWLLKIARNTCRDFLRRAWRKHEVSKEDLSAFGQASPEDRDLILDVMRLPEKYRAAVLLFYLQGMTLREAAHILRVSPSTVSRRLDKAKEILKHA